MRSSTKRVALFVLVCVAVLSVAELTSERFTEFTQGHPLIATFITEAVLLVGVYLVIDEIIQRRETGRWSEVTSFGVRALSTKAREPSNVVRDAVGKFAAELGLERAESLRADSAACEMVVSDRARELEDWLRADDTRAGSFARAMRRGASGLEDAIIRWGPTLVEDPDSAELINLLPDIVDAARSAASVIDPDHEWFDGAVRGNEAVDVAEGWMDEDRRSFADDLIVVVSNAAKFDRQLSSHAVG
jgi:hypothetical protein